MKKCSVKNDLVWGRFHVGGRLAALGVALGVAMLGASAMADAKWTYDSSAKTLTGIPAAGETATVLTLTDAGALSVKTKGTQKEIDLRSAAMPNDAPAIKTMDVMAGCSAMETLYLPESVEELKDEFCRSASALKQVVFPEDCKLTTIPGVAFYYCTKLEGVEIPEGVKVIGRKAFEGASAMNTVKLPETLEVLGERSFCDCTAIVDVDPFLPNSVTNIGRQAFYGASAMAITNDLLIGFGEREVTLAVDANNDSLAFGRCYLPSVKFGPMVKKVPRVFYTGGYSGVGYLEVGENVVEFDDCMGITKNLEKVVFKTTKDLTFPPQTFTSYSKFPNTVKEIVFNGWVKWTASTGNPFDGLAAGGCRFVVPGNNLKWASFMADSTKMTPWADCTQAERNAYSTLFADGTTPAGMTVKQTGMNRVYVVTDGTTVEGNYLVFENHKDEFGALTCEPALGENGKCEAESVTVTFAPAEGVTFTGWTGDVGDADTTSATITLSPSGIAKVTPTFVSTFLVYDEDAGELTNGDWVHAASGGREAITLGAFQRTNFGTASYAMDMSMPVKGGGAIVGIDVKLSGLSAVTSFTLPTTLKTMGSGVFQYLKVPILNLEALGSVTSIGNALFADTSYSGFTGSLRLGFATDENGATVNTSYGEDLFTRGGWYLGPTVEFGPGITYLTASTFHEDNFACKHEGPVDVWFGPNLAGAADGSMGSSIGGTNSVSFHFQGDMFAGTSSMFSKTTTAKSNYRYRFYIGADGCRKWQEFMENTDYVTPWDDLDASVQAEYRKRFKGRAFGLTTAAAALSDGSGLPEAVWVLSLKKSGFVVIVR